MTEAEALHRVVVNILEAKDVVEAAAVDLVEVEANQLLRAFMVLDRLFESMIELRAAWHWEENRASLLSP